MIVRNMRLAVLAEDRPVRVDHGDRIECGVAHALVIADRQHDPKGACDRPQRVHRGVFLQRCRQMVVFIALFLAEIPVFKQLGQQDDLRALRGRLLDPLHRVFQPIGHLYRGYGYFAHMLSLLIRLVIPALTRGGSAA